METLKCELPPEGWACKREAGHDGPCAAEPILNPVAALRMLLRQPITGDYYELRIGKEFRNALLAELDRRTPAQAAQGDGQIAQLESLIDRWRKGADILAECGELHTNQYILNLCASQLENRLTAAMNGGD